uniref:Uncharacterized protein n=1 Tax=Emiliania huxleyi TaxID=2903 RepID=A0A7S3W6P0_EMIHU
MARGPRHHGECLRPRTLGQRRAECAAEGGGEEEEEEPRERAPTQRAAAAELGLGDTGRYGEIRGDTGRYGLEPEVAGGSYAGSPPSPSRRRAGAAEEGGEWRRGGGSPSLFPPPQRLCAWGATAAAGAPPLPPSSLAPKPEPPPFGFTPPARVVAWAADDASRDAKRPRSPAWLLAGAERTGATMRHPVGPRVLHTARELVRESKAILSAAPHPARLRPTGPFDA